MSKARCGCGREWDGANQAHCTVCHRHFSTVANFDRHRPSYDGCLDPAHIVNARTGQPVLKASEGPFGTTWVGAGEFVGPRATAVGSLRGVA